ncbi:hypothetical protein JOE40_000713 [Arthrobacter sp. PvP102]|jgi:hypothetical protein|nr:hypothetical protein [Arthrobacter sp. PvP103]MBP1236204.1 hypothetical protein [Arthrobacter sp. PvP102]
MQQPPVLKQDDLHYIASGLIARSPGVYLVSHVVSGRFPEGAP